MKRPGIIRVDPALLIPDRVRSGEIQLARYTIHACGMAPDTVGNVIVDRRIALVQPHPESTLYLCPLRENRQPTSAEAWFYSDCIAYEHEVPALVMPTGSEVSAFRHRYLHNGPSKPQECEVLHLGNGPTSTEKLVRRPIPARRLTQAFLMDQLLSILEETREIRHGPLTFVLFRTHRRRRRVHLNYSAIYGSVAKEISLYGAALRQADFLSEYLGYYRVIESATSSNGRHWISGAIGRLHDHRFGRVLIGHEEDLDSPPKNAFGLYRRRAAGRLRQLRRTRSTDEDLARYLYEVNRCGIAHGRDSIVRGEIVPSYFEVGRDAVVLKLLARMAIDEKRELRSGSGMPAK